MNEELMQKLGVDKFERKAILNLPKEIHYFDGIVYDTELKQGTYDLIIVFVLTIEELKSQLLELVKTERLNPLGVIYIIYPKKGNKRYKTYIHRDEIFPNVEMDEDGYVYGSTIKFNKMVAFDESFTAVGLKNISKSPKKSTQPSQCVSDYIDRIPELEQLLTSYPETLQLFQALTPGYQRGWARYIFGVKNKSTSEKRLMEMQEVLRLGFKSIDLYRQAKK